MKQFNTIPFNVVAALIICASSQVAFSQTGVKIAATPGVADPSAMLDIVSSNKGLLVPRVNLVGLTNATSPIASPATGLLVYNLGGGGVPAVGFYYWTGAAWVQLTAGGFSGAGTVNYVTKWTASNALGNSQIFDNGTNVGIGHAGPVEKLDVAGNIKAAGVVYWGNSGTRTETRDDAGIMGGRSGFFETSAPAPAGNWYPGASSWQHLLETRHSNTGNNYALQIAGSFFDQNLWFRKTNNSGATGWTKFVTTGSNEASTLFTHWGRQDCPATSSLVYAGYVVGSSHAQGGSGANTLCLTSAPSWAGAVFNDGDQNGALIYSAEYETNSNQVTTLTAMHDREAVCAVCLVDRATVTLMVPGSTSCPASQGWTQQYWGYLMSTHYTQAKSEYVCVVNNPINPSPIGSTTNHNGLLWYPTELEGDHQTNTFVLPGYVRNREITCSVCTK